MIGEERDESINVTSTSGEHELLSCDRSITDDCDSMLTSSVPFEQSEDLG